jgi:aminoglycoside phosphotransferase (APT) family kinase protein
VSHEDLPGLDLTRLCAYLEQEVPGLVSGQLHGEVIPGGRSNLTYAVGDGGSRWVVRRPPLGHVLPTAHDMAREHRVISGLRTTNVPVPKAIALCQDPGVLGAPFYVMEFVVGTPYHRADELRALGPERTRSIADTLVDTLVELHSVDPVAAGLGDFGRPSGFLERQLRRWKGQLDSSRSRDLDGIDQLHDGLAAAIPASGPPAIVHGDYRLGNVLVDDTDRISAVLDWEMSTLGDPLTDLALLIAYSEHGKINPGAASDVSQAPGFPAADELTARYAGRSGRDISALNWYLGFAFFKLAVISEGIYYRFRHGQTVGAGFDQVGTAVEPLIRRGNETREKMAR